MTAGLTPNVTRFLRSLTGIEDDDNGYVDENMQPHESAPATYNDPTINDPSYTGSTREVAPVANGVAGSLPAWGDGTSTLPPSGGPNIVLQPAGTPPSQAGDWQPLQTERTPAPNIVLQPSGTPPTPGGFEPWQTTPAPQIADTRQQDEGQRESGPAPWSPLASEPTTLTPQQPSAWETVADTAASAGRSVKENVIDPVINAGNAVIDTAAAYGLKPGGDMPDQLHRLHEISKQAARETGRNQLVAVRDPAWRAANPELAAEHDELEAAVMMNTGLSLDAPARVAANATRVARGAARALPEADTALEGAMRAPNTSNTAGVAENIIEAERTRALPAGEAVPVPADRAAADANWREFSRSIDSPEQQAARTEAARPPTRANEDQPIREQFGRPIDEIPPSVLGDASTQVRDEGSSWRGPRERAYPEDLQHLSPPRTIEPQSISLNARPGISAPAGLVGDLGNAVGGGVAGAATGAALPAETDEERRRNALTGAAVGMVAGPAAGRLIPRAEGALATGGVAPNGRRLRLRTLPEGAQAIKATDAAEVSRLRLDKFPEEVRDLIEAGAKEQDWARTQRRGVMPDDVVQARSMDDAASVDQLIKSGKAGKAYNAEETVALRNAVASQSDMVRSLTDEIADARANNMTPDLLIARRAAEATKLNGLIQVAEGARAEAGRTLRQYRQQAKLIELNPNAAIEQIYKKLGGRENAGEAVDEYTKMVKDGANPIQLAKFWAKVESGKITGSDLFALYRRFNMLSGPRTAEVNILSGLVNLGYEVLGAGVGQAARGRFGEAASEVVAPLKASSRAFKNMAETMWHGVSTEQAARGDIPRNLSSRTDNTAAKAALTTMEIPDRFNSGVDQFFRTMTEDWAATRLANKQARAAGLSPRSSGWSEAVAKNLESIRDDPSKFPEVKAMADRVTFSEEPGGIVKWLEEGKRKYPNIIGFITPFVRTPANIASRAVDLSPIGPVRTAIEAGTGLGRGREMLPERIRDNAIGVGATMWAYNEAQKGNLTGAGPDDPEKQAELRATGWQPYSVKIGDRYWSYANFAPFSLALSTGAAAHEAQKYAKDGKTDSLSMLADGAERTGKVVTDMTVLAGIGAVIKSIQDPDRYGGRWLSQSLQQLMPAGSLVNTVGQATDDVQRRAERDTIANQVTGDLKSRVPGLRQTVPAAQDPLGRSVPNEQTGIGALNPFRPTTERPDAAIQQFLDAGVDIGAPKDSLSVRPGAAPITLTPAEQRRWNDLRGAQLTLMSPKLSESPGFQTANRPGREVVMKRVLNQAGEAADRLLIGEIGAAEVSRRMREAATKKAN